VVGRVELGTAALTRVVEWQVDQLPLALFPQTPPEVWRDLAEEFSPTFWTDAHWRIALQTWVIEVDGLTVLVDTGAGNDRDRPAMAPLDHLDTDFLASLQRAGVTPDAVDVVVNTHVHSDHVGWNTKRDNDSWIPTFPNARYVIPEVD
jgi:glyoxylase-like metal-dependent hydrolase (beta-lactamase superfamily II)